MKSKGFNNNQFSLKIANSSNRSNLYNKAECKVFFNSPPTHTQQSEGVIIERSATIEEETTENKNINPSHEFLELKKKKKK